MTGPPCRSWETEDPARFVPLGVDASSSVVHPAATSATTATTIIQQLRISTPSALREQRVYERHDPCGAVLSPLTPGSERSSGGSHVDAAVAHAGRRAVRTHVGHRERVPP